MADKTTLVINNFTGALTRNNFGDINSGLANFDTSFGYNPFFSPGELTWFKSPGDITSSITDSSLVLAGKSRLESGTAFTYVITDSGKIFKLTGEGGASSLIATLSSGSPTFTYGATMEFYNGVIMVGHDKGITRINFDGSSETVVGTWDATNYRQSTSRPMKQFGDLLIYGNATNDGTKVNIGSVNSSYTVDPDVLTGGFPTGTYCRDLDVTPDLTYLLITQSFTPPEAIAPVNDTGNIAAGESWLFKWNGADANFTTGIALPGFSATATQSFSDRQMMFMYDTFGAALFEGGVKRWTLRNQKSPFPNATTSTGNFVSWAAPDVYWNLDLASATMNGSLYYYGQLDEQTPPGLFRLLRQTSAISGAIYTMPFNHFAVNRFLSVNSSAQPIVVGNGTHFLSWIDYGGGATINKKLYYFYAAPPDDSSTGVFQGWTGAIAGVYQTQTQMFSKKFKASQIRVYTNPTVTGNGFNLDLIGPNGKKITNGSFSYTFVNGTDPTTLTGALDRINFQAATAPFYGVGVRITNTGANNWVCNKVEIDVEPAGK